MGHRRVEQGTGLCGGKLVSPSSLNIGAFNLGNALGAALGGLVIGQGLGYAAMPVVGAALAATGLRLVWLGQVRRRSTLDSSTCS